MDIFEELKNWLVEQGAEFDIDRCGQVPGSIGLFPQGMQLLRQWEDVLGQRKRRVRYRFLLRLIAPPGETVASLLLRMQDEAPRAGFSATDGILRKTGSDGLAIYEIRLSAEREENL